MRALGKLKACVTNTLEIKEIDQLMAGFESLDQVIQSMKKLSICTRLNKMFDYAYEEYSKDPSVENSLKLQDSLISLPKITSSHVNLFEHEIQRKELGELDRVKGLVAENQRQKFCF